MTEHSDRWHGNAADLIGREFGRLVVVARAGSINGNATWVCRCDCLGSCVVQARLLLSGTVRSCGCLRREHASRLGSRVMSTHPKWRGKLLPLPNYEDDPVAVADHTGLLPWESYEIVFRPDRKLLSRPRGRPPLPAAEVARREAARRPRGRPCQDPGRQTLRECLWRIAQAARAAGIDPAGSVGPGSVSYKAAPRSRIVTKLLSPTLWLQ